MGSDSPPSKKVRLEDAPATTSLALTQPIHSGSFDLGTVRSGLRESTADIDDDDDFADIYNTPDEPAKPSTTSALALKDDGGDGYDTDFDPYSSEPDNASKPEQPPGPGLDGQTPNAQAESIAATLKTNGHGTNGTRKGKEPTPEYLYNADADEDEAAERSPRLGRGTPAFILPGLSGSLISLPGLPPVSTSARNTLPGLPQVTSSNESTLPGLPRVSASARNTLPGLPPLTGNQSTLPGLATSVGAGWGTRSGFNATMGGISSTLVGASVTMTTNAGFSPDPSRSMSTGGSVLKSVGNEWEVDSNPEISSTDSDHDTGAEGDSVMDFAQQADILMGAGADSGDDDDEGGPLDNAAKKVKTKNEMEEDAEGLAGAEKLHVPVTMEMKIVELGEIVSIVKRFATIEAKMSGERHILEPGSLLCLADRKVVGCISEVMGLPQQPYYGVQFPTSGHLAKLDLNKGTTIFYVKEHSTFVLPGALKHVKGSDASNIFDEEVADDELEFSDDEAEAAHRRRKREEREEREEREARFGDGPGFGSGHGPGPRRDQPSTRPSKMTQKSLPGLNYDESTIPKGADSDGEPYHPLARPSNYQALIGNGGTTTAEEGPSRGNFSQGGRGGRMHDRGRERRFSSARAGRRTHDGGRERRFSGHDVRGSPRRGGRGELARGRGRPHDHHRQNRDDAVHRRRSDPYGSGPRHQNSSRPSTGNARYSLPHDGPPPLPPRFPPAIYDALMSDEYDPAVPNAAALVARVEAQMSELQATANQGQYEQQQQTYPPQQAYPAQPYTPETASFQHASYTHPMVPAPPQFYTPQHHAQPASFSGSYSAPQLFGTMPTAWAPAPPPGPSPVPAPFWYAQTTHVPTTVPSMPTGSHEAGGHLPAGAFVNPAFFRNPLSTPMRSHHGPATTPSSAIMPGMQPPPNNPAPQFTQEQIDYLLRLAQQGHGGS
ncbi:MAG: hypothetical protein M1823_002162 [Watsoniomyces obsoletus]|nr:MAG: hypothetical protein M1823_002162 [Watsoniomyces obsoletus]